MDSLGINVLLDFNSEIIMEGVELAYRCYNSPGVMNIYNILIVYCADSDR